MNLEPTNPNHLLIKPLFRNRSTELIHIPAKHHERTNFALVLKRGDNCPKDLIEGVLVIYEVDYGRPIELDEETLRDIHFKHILATVEEEEVRSHE